MRIFDQEHAAIICMDEQETLAIRLAVQDLLKDLEKVSGRNGHQVIDIEKAQADCVVVGTLNQEKVERCLHQHGVNTDPIRGKREHFLLQEKDDLLFLIGSDEFGTIEAIYECCEKLLGVDPQYLFTNHQPAHQDSLEVKNLFLSDGPETRFRGWFINDEDLIMGYCRQGVPEKEYDFHQDYAPMLSMIVETALRMKQNLLIPASHIDMDDPAQEALVKLVTDRGLYISMHHQEPVGVNQQRLDKWYAAQGDETVNINYVDHPEKYRRIWRHFIHKWAQYPRVIWQLGLRGRGDRPVWYQNDRVPETIEARGTLISQALQDQWDIIAEETGTTDFMSSTTLWMEGMPLYRAGALIFPKNTMVILSDFGPDQMFGDEFYDTPRLPGIQYGVYYHVCFWGCGPHLVQGNRPEKIIFNYQQTRNFGDDTYSILNVSNIREHVQGIFCVAKAVWNRKALTEAELLEEWCRQEFPGCEKLEIADLYQQYYDSFTEMDNTRLPGRMLLMDGMCKRVATMLMKIIAGAELEKVDIQNKRLFNFPDTDSFIAFYLQATASGMMKFEKVMEEAKVILKKIPSDRQMFFMNNLILQTQTILSLYTWVHDLCLAAANRRDQDQKAGIREESYTEIIDHAADALKQILDMRSLCLEAEWKHWWEGDTLINVSDIYRRTLQLKDLSDASEIQKAGY